MTAKKFLLDFPKCETEKPIVYTLVKDYDLRVNIFRAIVKPDEHGYLVLDVTGEEENIENAKKYLQTFDIKIFEDVHGVVWDEEKCTHCGNCIPHCPTNALHVNKPDMHIGFDAKTCIECLACIRNCPFKACTSIL